MTLYFLSPYNHSIQAFRGFAIINIVAIQTFEPLFFLGTGKINCRSCIFLAYFVTSHFESCLAPAISVAISYVCKLRLGKWPQYFIGA